MVDLSNRLTSAQSQVAMRDGTILTYSNRLDESLSASMAFSNQLLEAQSAIVSGKEQITNLSRQVAEAELQNQTLGRRVMNLTNQIARGTNEIALLEASLTQTNRDLVQAGKDYVLLENRFRMNVAERTVVERKFNNPMELQAQIKKLKKNPAGVISTDSIYAGLNVVVSSNGSCHVMAPN
jgi:chromosome segregation ATPase